MPAYYPLFVVAVTLLMLTPGPNVALIVANSVTHGTRYGLLTVAGTLLSATVLLILVGIGLGGALSVVGSALDWARWVGAAYLLVLGWRTWREPPADLARVQARQVAIRPMVLRAAVVSLTNPKTLLFYGAFFPQFIAADRPLGPQVWMLCVTFWLIAAVVDSIWAIVAGRARRYIARYGRLRQRLSGGLLMGAGVGLALARVR